MLPLHLVYTALQMYQLTLIRVPMGQDLTNASAPKTQL